LLYPLKFIRETTGNLLQLGLNEVERDLFPEWGKCSVGIYLQAFRPFSLTTLNWLQLPTEVEKGIPIPLMGIQL
jgi:hypothetical protein